MIRINNQQYKVATGFSTTYTLDKSLDFGSLVIPVINREEPFDMFSEIEITRDNNTIEYFLLSGDIVEISSYQPVRYSHRIEFVEYTKKLEFYTISSATFTQPTDGSTLYNIDDVLQRLVNISVFETSTRHTAAKPCVLDPSIAAKLGNVKSPEFFFNNITLREALDTVLSSIPGIARMQKINNVDTLFVDYFDETKAIVDISEGVGYTAQQDIQNYSTTLVADVSNALRATQGVESVTVFPNNNGWASVSSPLGVGVLDNDKVVFDVKEDIYDLVSLEIFAKIRVVYRDTSNNQVVQNNIIFEGDITQYVFTKNQYENGLGGDWSYTADITQQNAIYFNTGSRVIEGLGTNWASGFLTQNVNKRRSIEHIIATELIAQGVDPFIGIFRVEIINDDNQNDLTNLLFRAQFIPIEKSNRVEVEKEDITYFSKETKTFFKQSAALVNLNHYIKSMKSDLQRIGEEKFATMILHKSFGNILQIGDFLNDGHILMTRTITQEKDFVMANYEFSRNYQQINEFIGVNKAKNEFELISEDKVIDRFVVYKDYVVLSDVATPTIALDNESLHLLTTDGMETYMQSFTQNNTRQMIEASVWNPDPTITLLNGVNASGAGSSLILSSSFNHQQFAGFQIIPNNNEDGGLIQSPVSYAFEGFLENFEIQFIDEFTDPPLSFDLERNRARVLPLLGRTDFNVLISTNTSGPLMLFKDPGERLHFTYQLQAINHPNFQNQFIIGNYFHDFNHLVNNEQNTLFVFGSNTIYNKSEKEVRKNDATALGQLDATFSGTFDARVLSINNSLASQPAFNSYAITDSNGRLVLAVNRQNNVLPNQIKFSFTHKRPELNKL